MSMFTGNIDVDLLILYELSDMSLVSVCSSTKYFTELCDEHFWESKFYRRFGVRMDRYFDNPNYRKLYLKFSKLTDRELFKTSVIDGYINILERLIEDGVDVAEYDQPLYSIELQWDVDSREDDEDLSYIETTKDTIDGMDATSTMYAIYNGDITMVKLLLSSGANIRGVNVVDDGAALLKIAILNNDIEMVDLLLDYGAAPDDTEQQVFDTALDYAIKNNNPIDVMELLIKKGGADVIGYKGYVLKSALRSGRREVIELILNNLSDADLQRLNRYLYEIAKYGGLTAIKIIADKGVNFSTFNQEDLDKLKTSGTINVWNYIISKMN